MSVVQVKDLFKSYKKGFIPKKTQVLNGVSFTIEPGTVTGFLGGNGAGKTTTMKCMLGLSFPDSGDIRFFNNEPLSPSVLRRLGFLPERPYFYDYLTGEEFLRFYGEISNAFKKKNDLKQRIDFLLKKVDLEHARDRALRSYSKGMLQKIGLAQALVHRPEFVVLDEPMAGLDPDGRFYLSELISETAKQGTSIFFSSHLLHDTEKMCKNLVIIKDGKTAYAGTTKDLIQKVNSQVTVSYIANGKLTSKVVDRGSNLQNLLDALLKDRHEVLSIDSSSMALEKAFIDLALNAKNREVSQ